MVAVGSSAFSSAPSWRNSAHHDVPWDGSSVTATTDVVGSSQPTEAGRHQAGGHHPALSNYTSPTSYPSDLHTMMGSGSSSSYAPVPPAPAMMVQNGGDEYSTHASTPSKLELMYAPPPALHSGGVGSSSSPGEMNPGPRMHSVAETNASATPSASTTDMERRLRELRDDADRALADLGRAQSAQAPGNSRRDEDAPPDGDAPPAYDSNVNAHR